MKITNSYKIFSLLIMLLLSSCLSTVSETTCGEGEAYDAEDRTCVPTIAEGPNTIFVSSSFPVSSAYGTNLTSSTVNHSITVSNQFNNEFAIIWTLYNGSVATQVALGSSVYTFDPSTLPSTGTYILEAGVYNNTGTILYDSKTWTISISDLESPSIINTSPAINVLTLAENLSSVTLSADISSPDNLNGQYRFILNSDTANAINVPFTNISTFASFDISPGALGLGLHSLELQVRDTSLAQNEYDSHIWTINIIEPDLPKIDLATTTPSPFNSISIIDGIAFQDTNSTTPTRSGFRDINGNEINSFCVTVDDSDKNDDGNSDIYLEFEINGTKQGATGFFASGSNTYCHESFNIQNLINSDVSESRTIVINSFNSSTNELIETVQYNASLRPKNLRPLITIANATTTTSPSPNEVSCSTEASTVLYSNCSMIQSSDSNSNGDYSSVEDSDNSKNFTISFLTESDPDLDITDTSTFNVFYQIKSDTSPNFEILNGSSTLSLTACNTNTLTCSINIDAFNSAGNLPPGTYTVQAYLEDTGSIWETAPVPKASNLVSWIIEVEELQEVNSISIADQSSASNIVSVAPGESWLENAGSDCSTLGTITNTSIAMPEHNFLKVHTYVKDHERDDFKISMNITNSVGGGVTPIVGTTTINRVDGDEYIEVESCFRVPQYVVSGFASIDANLNVTVIDIPDDTGSIPQADTNTFTFNVTNFNPVPSFDDSSTVDLSSFISFAGFPFSLNAPSFSDLSTTDGDNIIFKWQSSRDNSNWEDIPNANSTDQVSANLIWTAPPTFDGTMSFRLCLGDDGTGNPADCVTNPSAAKLYENLVVRPSQYQLNSFATSTLSNFDRKNVSTWLDQETQFLYTVYSIGADIYVNKRSINTDGTITDVHTISFQTAITNTNGSRASTLPESLSIAGVNEQALLISYTMPDNMLSGDKTVRVRRIDLSNNKLTYKYGGFFNEETDTNDQVDSIVATGLTISDNGTNGDMRIRVNTVESGDGFTINLSSGQETFSVTGSTPALAASNLADSINNHINPEISEELFAEYTSGNNFLTIHGSNVEDYYNGLNSMPFIGDISINRNNNWAIPIIDTNNSSQLNVLRSSTNVLSSLNGTSPVTSTSIATSQFNKSVQGKFLSNGRYVLASRNGNNNISIYELDLTYNLVNSIEDAYLLNGSIVTDFDLDIGYDITDSIDSINIASILENSSGSSTKVGAIMVTSDFSNHIATDSISSSSDLTVNVREVNIRASKINKGEATIAVIISDTNVNPNSLNLFKFKVNHPLETGTFETDISLNVSTDTSYVSPVLQSGVLENSSLALTDIFQVTKGHFSEDSTVEDVTREVFYVLSFKDQNPDSNLNLNLINTQSEDIMTNDTSATNSYPAFLKN